MQEYTILRETEVATFSIIGCGKVGKTIASLLCSSGFKLQYVVNRTILSSRRAVRFAGMGIPRSKIDLSLSESDIILIAVPDDSISLVANKLKLIVRTGQVLIHCSGSLSSDVIKVSKKVSVGSVHFVRSFADPKLSVANFKGTYCAYECDRIIETLIKGLIRSIKGVPIKISPTMKSVYHAGSVTSSNFLVALAYVSRELFKKGGLNNRSASKLFLSLAKGTLQNIETKGVIAALTGPIERGDTATIKSHLNYLPKEYSLFYKILSFYTAKVAQLKGTDKKNLHKILDLL